MNARKLTFLAAALGFSCAGCVVAPPPPPTAMMPPPAPQAMQAPAQQAAPGTCREFQQTITIGGTPQAGYGTTCQQPDGSWRVMEGPQAPPPSPSQSAPPQVAAAPNGGSFYPVPYAPYPTYAYAYAPGYYTYGGVYVRGRWR